MHWTNKEPSRTDRDLDHRGFSHRSGEGKISLWLWKAVTVQSIVWIQAGFPGIPVCNPSTKMAEAGGSLQVQGQPEPKRLHLNKVYGGCVWIDRQEFEPEQVSPEKVWCLFYPEQAQKEEMQQVRWLTGQSASSTSAHSYNPLILQRDEI